jgi:hypothetical protein
VDPCGSVRACLHRSIGLVARRGPLGHAPSILIRRTGGTLAP